MALAQGSEMKNTANGTELVTIAKHDALSFFTEPNGSEHILARIRQEIDGFDADVSTTAGRKAIASMAYRVAQSKTYIDGVGKELVAEYKEIPKKIDASRKRIRDTLDQWRDEVRAPLTAWEQAEKDRIDKIEACLAEFQAVIDDQTDRPSDLLRERLDELRREAITEQFYAEFSAKAAELKDRAVRAVEAQLALAEKREAEAAEASRLQAEAAAKAQMEREAQIAKEAAAAAERKAAEVAEAERKAAAEREARLQQEKEAAERWATEAAAQAKREMEQKAARERAEQQRREDDKKHRAKINNEALAAFVSHGISDELAKQVVTLIAAREIPNVRIEY